MPVVKAFFSWSKGCCGHGLLVYRGVDVVGATRRAHQSLISEAVTVLLAGCSGGDGAVVWGSDKELP